jgi:hypothetical protein
MNFKVIHARPRTSSETDYFLKDDDNNDWTFRLTKTTVGGLREFTMYPKHWKSLLKSTSLANLTRKSHLYELAMKAIDSWNIKKDLSPSTLNTFEDIIDEL